MKQAIGTLIIFADYGECLGAKSGHCPSEHEGQGAKHSGADANSLERGSREVQGSCARCDASD